MKLIIKQILLIFLFVLSCSCKYSNPKTKIESFDVYGRYNPNLKDSSRIMLSYTTDEETFMHIGKLKGEKPIMQRIHGNIYSRKFPEIFSTIKKLDTLSFTSLPNQNSTELKYIHKIYTFCNKENFNDFIVYYHPQYKIDQLAVMLDSNPTLDLDLIPDFKSLTIKYNDNHAEIKSDKFKRQYVLDKKRNAYRDKWNYVDGEENAKDYDFNNKSLFFIYKRMKEFDVSNQEITIDDNSIFKVHHSR